MRVFFAVLILIFSFQSWTKADDIRDFEIEGMSIGDSALDHFSEEYLLSTKNYSWENKKFALSNGTTKGQELFKYWQIYYLDNDDKYIIHYLAGYTEIENLEECNKKKEKIVEEVKNITSDYQLKDLGRVSHPGDKTGKSLSYKVEFHFKDKSLIMVTCTDYTEVYKNNNNLLDNLSVSAHSKEFSEFLNKVY